MEIMQSDAGPYNNNKKETQSQALFIRNWNKRITSMAEMCKRMWYANLKRFRWRWQFAYQFIVIRAVLTERVNDRIGIDVE